MSEIFTAVDRISGALDFHRARHSVLASNLANVDTPGYRPRDLEPVRPADGSPLARTHAAHVTGTERPYRTVTSFDASSASASADGNAVHLERELAKLDANRVRYQAASEFVSRRVALLRYAASDGQG